MNEDSDSRLLDAVAFVASLKGRKDTKNEKVEICELKTGDLPCCVSFSCLFPESFSRFENHQFNQLTM